MSVMVEVWLTAPQFADNWKDAVAPLAVLVNVSRIVPDVYGAMRTSGLPGCCV